MQRPWDQLPDDATIERTAAALRQNGMDAEIVANGAEAKRRVLELLPPEAEVMNMTSMTLEAISAVAELKSDKFRSVHTQLEQMDRKTQGRDMQRLGAAPEWVVGSVHAVTEDGHVLVASNSGSQLPAYASGADHVVWVVGAQKIVRDTAAGLRRLYEHSLVLESERARKAYNVPGSAVNKILIVNREIKPGRITIILVKEVLGF